MWIRTICFLAFLLAASCLTAQTFKAYLKAAEQAEQRADHQAAVQYIGEALALRPDEAALTVRYADAALRFHAYGLAEQHYLKVVEGPDADRHPTALLGLGKAYQRLGQYDKAIGYLQAYSKHRGAAAKLQAEAQRLLQQCQWARGQQPEEEWQLSHLGRSVNTPYSEFAPLLRGDTLYYSSLRYERDEDDYKPARKIAKLLHRKGEGRGRPMRRGFNDDKQHTAHTAFSLDGRRIYYTLCDYVNASEIRCQLVYREQDRRGRWSSKFTPLPPAINQAERTATHPAIGYDSLAQSEVLFFAAQQPGQGMDLFQVLIDTAGQFGEPMPLAGLNTEQDDMTPFFHTPTQTLYFSSEGHLGFGGLDLFFALREGEGWSSPQNMGAPVNSSYNDLYLSFSEDPHRGVLSSNRPGTYYLDEDSKACCNDLYDLRYVPPAPPPEVALEKEDSLVVTPEPKLPVLPKVPSTLQDFLPLALYFDNDEPDRRTRRTSTKRTYGETYEDYAARRSEYQQAFAGPLSGERREEAELAVDQFFDEEAQRGYDLLNRFCEILLQRLSQGDTVEIFLKGYTSPRAKRDYNLALSQRRISSVRNHFRSHQDGVFLPFLEQSQLLLSERPFGEAEASDTVSDVLDDLRNSVYHPDAARERRVEIVEIRD